MSEKGTWVWVGVERPRGARALTGVGGLKLNTEKHSKERWRVAKGTPEGWARGVESVFSSCCGGICCFCTCFACWLFLMAFPQRICGNWETERFFGVAEKRALPFGVVERRVWKEVKDCVVEVKMRGKVQPLVNQEQRILFRHYMITKVVK